MYKDPRNIKMKITIGKHEFKSEIKVYWLGIVLDYIVSAIFTIGERMKCIRTTYR